MVVNTNSAQTQFQALLSSKTDLLQQLQQIESEHASRQTTLHQIRAETNALTTKFQSAKYQHGSLSKKRSVLLGEISRLKSIMMENDTSLKEVAHEVALKEEKERDNKMDFVREMESVNDELRDVLRRTEEARILDCNWMNLNGCLEIVRVLQDLKKEESFCSMSNDDGKEEEEEGKIQNSSFLVDIEDLVQRWNGYSKEKESLRQNVNAWKERVSSLRTQIQTEKALGDHELDELERLWGESEIDDSRSTDHVSYSNACHHQDDSVDMALFYGATNHDHYSGMEVDAS